ncbi:MAG: hypothetical protein ACREYE_22840 [Gammaproteobacteria bacterium]
MRAPINQRLLTSLKAQPRPYEVHDVKVKGFILRVQPSGVLTYIVEYGRADHLGAGVHPDPDTGVRQTKHLKHIVPGGLWLRDRR